MSTLKVAAINNPSAGSGGLAISAAGNVTGAGLDLIVTQSFSAVSSVSLDNVFTGGDYDNYRLELAISSQSTAGIAFRWRASGSDTSTSTYNSAYGRGGRTSTADGGSLTSQTKFIPVYGTTGYKTVLSMDIYRANVSGGISAASLSFSYDSGYIMTYFGSTCTQATAHDGLTIYTTTGSMTGIASVYGYKS